MLITAIIIDDEQAARDNLKLLLDKFCPNVEILGMANNISKGISLILEHDPELVFLDVDMPGGSGFDLIEKLGNNAPKIIFTTAFEKYALKALKAAAIDYLLKPIDKDELITAINKSVQYSQAEMKKALDLLSQRNQQNGKLVVTTTEEIRLVDLDSILYLEAHRNYTMLYLTENKKLVATKNLSEMEQQLPENNFMRVHKSFVVNLNHVEAYRKGRGGYLILNNKDYHE